MRPSKLYHWPSRRLVGHFLLTGSVPNARAGDRGLFRRAGRARSSQALRVYPDSSERLNDLTVRVRSLLANSAATGFINRIKPKSSPSAT